VGVEGQEVTGCEVHGGGRGSGLEGQPEVAFGGALRDLAGAVMMLQEEIVAC